MTTGKKVGFLGSFQVDFIQYCARCLAQMNKKVLVVDESSTEEIGSLLFGSAKGKQSAFGSNFFGRRSSVAEELNFELTIVHRNRVDYTTSEKMDTLREEETAYDFVLFYFGEHAEKEKLQNLEEVFALTFCDYFCLERLHRLMREYKVPMHVILRNVCGNKSNRKSYFAFLEQENAFIEERFSLPFDEIDETYRIRMQYEPVSEFHEISQQMEKTIRKVLELLCPEEVGAIPRAIGKAKRGAWL